MTGGNVGETNIGLVEIRDETGLNLQAKAALRKLVKDENGDRMKLYAEVAKALNIEASQIDPGPEDLRRELDRQRRARLVDPAGRRQVGQEAGVLIDSARRARVSWSQRGNRDPRGGFLSLNSVL